ncbi:hypothetical protein K0H71_09155 [Bacillus sp. IITD106]|nr:hypothetical protein [Bacillus sp. IITD106]
MNEKNVIHKAFTDVVFVERVHQEAYKKCLEDTEYQLATEDAARLLRQLKETLSNNEQKKLLDELESTGDRMYSPFLEYCYCQGIEDSEMIHNQLKKYGISIVREDLEYNYISEATTNDAFDIVQ